MQFLGLRIRSDWRERDQELTLYYDRQWKVLWQTLAIACAVLLVSAVLFGENWGHWQPYIVPALAALLFAQALRIYAHSIESPILTRREVVIGIGLLAGAVLSIGWSLPAHSFVDPPGPDLNHWRLLAGVGAPVFILSIYLWRQRKDPVIWNRLGLNTSRPILDMVSGVLIGCSLGLHAWLVFQLLHGRVVRFDPWMMGWLALARVSLLAPGQEIFLRGVAFEVLSEGKQFSLRRTAVYIALMDAALGALPWLGLVEWADFTLLAVYWFAYGCLAVYLRHRLGNTWVTWAANLFFVLFLGLVVL